MTICGNTIRKGCVRASTGIGKNTRSQSSSRKMACAMKVMYFVNKRLLTMPRFYTRPYKMALMCGAIFGGVPGIILSGTWDPHASLGYTNATWNQRNENQGRVLRSLEE